MTREKEFVWSTNHNLQHLLNHNMAIDNTEYRPHDWNTTENTTSPPRQMYNVTADDCADHSVLPLISLNLVLGILSLLLNSLLLYTVSQKPYNPHRHLVRHLIIAYLIVAGCWVVIWSFVASNFSRCRSAPCQCLDAFVILLFNTGVIASMIHVLMMSVEHYVALFRPLDFKALFSQPRMTVTAGVLWCLAVLCSCSSFTQAIVTYYNSSDRRGFCEIFSSEASDQFLHYVLLAILAVSMVTLATVYVQICRDSATRFRTNINRNCASQKKLLGTTALIWMTFIVCWMPFVALTLATSTHSLGNLSCGERLLLMYLSAMPVVNSLCGPIIYTFRTHIRQDFAAICRKSGCSES